MQTFAPTHAPARTSATGRPHASSPRNSCDPCPSRGLAHTYWPCELLNAFILRMAVAGHSVSTAMMLGHRPYAMEQLEMARHIHDEELARMADQLQSYFDAPPQDCSLAISGSDQFSTHTLFRPWPLAS